LIISFPGLLPGDDIVKLVKLLTSKDPDGDISAAVALDGGYNPCDNSSLFNVPQTTRRKRSADDGCDDGFVADAVNGFCYTALLASTFFDDGTTNCKNNFDADVLEFDNDTKVAGLLYLLQSGEPCKQSNTFVKLLRHFSAYVIFLFRSMILKPRL
jgi:hypothetical protein